MANTIDEQKNPPRPDQILEAEFAKEVIVKILSHLSIYERELLKLRFFEDRSLEEIGAYFWLQVGLDGPATPEEIYIFEQLAFAFMRIELNRLNIISSRDLLPAD